MDKILPGHNDGHSSHSWNHQNARKLQCLLRDPRMCIMFPQGIFASVLWQRLSQASLARREQCLFPVASKRPGELLPAPILSKVFSSPAPGQNRGWGDQRHYFVSCQLFNLHAKYQSQPQKTGSISRHFFLFMFLRPQNNSLQCSIIKSLPLHIQLLSSRQEQSNKWSLEGYNLASRCFQRR